MRQRQLLDDGYVVLPNVLNEGDATQLALDVHRLAETERRCGTAWFSGLNQRVFDLLNKGDNYLDLALNSEVLRFVRMVLSEHALLSSITAHVVSPGAAAQQLHADQDYVWRPWSCAFVLNVVWMLDGFTATNGSTRVVPGSHLDGRATRSVVTVTGSQGSACLLDGRLLHGSGVNQDERPRTAILALYCAPFLRQQENFVRSLRPEGRQRLSAPARALLGFDIWRGLGAVQGLPTSWMGKAERTGPIDADRLSNEGHVDDATKSQ